MPGINSNDTENSNETDLENREMLSMVLGNYWGIFAQFKVLLKIWYQVNFTEFTVLLFTPF